MHLYPNSHVSVVSPDISQLASRNATSLQCVAVEEDVVKNHCAKRSVPVSSFKKKKSKQTEEKGGETSGRG